MADVSNINASLFKECYDLAAQYEQLDAAKNVLREKSKRLGNAEQVNDQGLLPAGETATQIVSEALYELSLEGYAGSDNNRPVRYLSRINELPDSGDKEYLLALLSLRNRMNETTRIEAMGHVARALSYSPNDPRYKVLSEILMRPVR